MGSGRTFVRAGGKLGYWMGFIPIALIIISLSGVVRSQDTTSSRLQRIGYVLGASAAFSFLDYVAINAAKGHYDMSSGTVPNNVYHILLGVVGAGLNYWLYTKLGLSAAIAFDLMWWSWSDDLGYMAWANILNPPSPWPNRTTEQFTRDICCAEWTPVGLAQGYKASLPRSTLFAQSAIGISVAFALLW